MHVHTTIRSHRQDGIGQNAPAHGIRPREDERHLVSLCQRTQRRYSKIGRTHEDDAHERLLRKQL